MYFFNCLSRLDTSLPLLVRFEWIELMELEIEMDVSLLLTGRYEQNKKREKGKMNMIIIEKQ